MGFSDQCPCQHRKSSNRQSSNRPWAPFLFVSWCLQQKPKQHSNNRRNESHVDIRSFFFLGDFPCRFCVRKSERTWWIEARLWGSKFGPRHELIEEGKKWCVNETFGWSNRTRIYIYIIYVCIYESRKLDIWNLSRYQWTIIRYYESKTLWKT